MQFGRKIKSPQNNPAQQKRELFNLHFSWRQDNRFSKYTAERIMMASPYAYTTWSEMNQ